MLIQSLMKQHDQKGHLDYAEAEHTSQKYL